MNSRLSIQLSRPEDDIDRYLQAVWSASSGNTTGKTTEWVYGDACTGILFNFGQPVTIGEHHIDQGVYAFPATLKAAQFVLPAGSALAGIRFRPGIGYGIFGKRLEQPVRLSTPSTLPNVGYLQKDLLGASHHAEKIELLKHWLQNTVDLSASIPDTLLQAIHEIENRSNPEYTHRELPFSQRQLERQFMKWLGITPKQYQRLIRVNRTLKDLKENPHSRLVNIAHENGFSDQSHMTREFQSIAKTTPKKFRCKK